MNPDYKGFLTRDNYKAGFPKNESQAFLFTREISLQGRHRGAVVF